ncbi:MAG: hypothetical protein K2N16_00820 [Muribaculaceae bacterium]|nr:hypothetical protein [Muribaculaceae bacterium]
MKLSLSALSLGLALSGLYCVPNAQAQKAPNHEINISRAMQSPQLRRQGVVGHAPASPTLTSPMKAKPSVEMGPTRSFYDIDGPNGELWYCSTELGVKPINHEYWTEYILQEYSFTIYDSEFKEVGTIHDKMRYADDELAVPGPDQGISVLPVVTKNFFNTDDKYEIVVALAVNAGPGINHYRSVVYSLGGDKETATIWRDGTEVTEQVDKAIAQYDGFIVDVLDVSANGQEDFYMTFADEYGPVYDLDFDKIIEGDEEEGQRYWEAISQSGNIYQMYGKAGADDKLSKVFTFECSYQQMQGDQESTPPMLTFNRDGQGYIVCPYYKDTFFNPYYSPWDENMSMRSGNSLVVDLYKIANGSTEKINTIEVPVEKTDKDGVLATYYSVGDLNYSADVVFNQQGNPMYVLTRCNYLISIDGTTDYCYYIYDSTGAKTVTVFENSDSNKPLTSVPGHGEQVMFVSYDDFEGYIYNFVDLLTGFSDKTVKIPALLDTGFDDPETLSANVDRVAIGDSYKYAFEMKTPLTDEYDNTFMRVAWFNADGSFDRIDHINMGQNVMYAQCWIDGAILDPSLIAADSEHEYLILVKRGISDTDSSSQEELIVGQPANEDLEGGKTLLNLGPCDKGELRNVSLYYPAADSPARLFVSYVNESGFNVEFYDLPLTGSTGIEGVEDDANAQIAYDGQDITAQGQIKVYSMQGALVAQGQGSVSTAGLPAGVYVAVAGNSSCKILVNSNR